MSLSTEPKKTKLSAPDQQDSWTILLRYCLPADVLDPFGVARAALLMMLPPHFHRLLCFYFMATRTQGPEVCYTTSVANGIPADRKKKERDSAWRMALEFDRFNPAAATAAETRKGLWYRTPPIVMPSLSLSIYKGRGNLILMNVMSSVPSPCGAGPTLTSLSNRKPIWAQRNTSRRLVSLIPNFTLYLLLLVRCASCIDR